MKILSLNYEYPPLGGGAGTLTEDLNRHLAAAGHRVSVVTMHFPGLPEHEVRDGVEIFRIPCLRKEKSFCTMREATSYIFSLRRFIAAHPELQRYDVCHCHFVVPTGLGARDLRRRYGIPYIVTAHGSDVEGHNDKKLIRLVHRAIRGVWRDIVDGSYRTVSPSNMLRDLMAKNHPSDRYRVIPHGIDVPDPADGLLEKDSVILLVGRMQESKNFRTVLRALSLLGPESLTGWRVEILGDGPCRKQLEELTEQNGLREYVTFRGWVDHGSAEQTELVRRAAVFISASRYESGCPPLAVLESAAAGSALILSDIPGHRFAGGDGTEYFPADDADALAEILRGELAKDPAGRTYDLRAFTWDAVTSAYEDLLRECAETAWRGGTRSE